MVDSIFGKIMKEFLICDICFSDLEKLKTEFSLYSRYSDIVIKNYPLYVCSCCGNVSIKKIDIKKTIYFLNQQKKKNQQKKLL